MEKPVPVGGPMPVESPVVYLHGPAVYRSVREMFMDLHRPTAVKRNNRFTSYQSIALCPIVELTRETTVCNLHLFIRILLFPAAK